MTPIPNDLWQAAFNVWHSAIPLIGTPQATAKQQLDSALADNDAQQVLDALHTVAREFQRDIEGHYMQERDNVTVRNARRLIDELEGIEEVAA